MQNSSAGLGLSVGLVCLGACQPAAIERSIQPAPAMPTFDEPDEVLGAFRHTGPTVVDQVDGRRFTCQAGNERPDQSATCTIWSLTDTYAGQNAPYVSLHPRFDPDPLPGTSSEFLGQSAAVLGDVDGDGFEDVVLGFFDEQVHEPTQARSVVFPGPFIPDPDTPVTRRYGTDPDVLPVPEAAWNYTPCDVNDDGLADICSARAIAIAPPPFDATVLLPDANPNDMLAGLEVNGVQVLARATSEGLDLFVAGDLPTLTVQQQLPTGGRAIALAHGDVTADPGEELLAVERDADGGHLVVYATDSELTEVLRFTSPWPDGPVGAVVVGDLDGDALADVAFSTGGYVGVLAGPLDGSHDITWWHAPHDDELPGFPFGSKLAIESAPRALMIGYPGRVYSREAQVWAGALYRVQEPTLP